MPRLPVPGSDDGTWGGILNEFLEVEHNADGTQKTVTVAKGGTGATSASGARSNLGLGDSATKNTGTTSGTVAAGDDSRITGAAADSAVVHDTGDETIAGVKTFTSTIAGNISGNAATATTATTASTVTTIPALTGDVTSNGSTNVTTLATIGSATGPIGNSTTTPVVTIDAKGRVTALGSATITAGSGEANTASNVGTAGVGVFKQKTGVDLEFKKINAGSTKIQVTDDTASNEVDIDVVTANLGLTKSDVGLANVTNDAQLKIASNLSDLASVSTARTNLSLGDSATKNTGTTSGTVAAGDHSHSTLPSSGEKEALAGTDGTPSDTNRYVTDSDDRLSGGVDASTTVKGISKLSVSPVSATEPIAVGDNDTRMTNARTPTAHATSHKSAGSDSIKLDELGTPTDITTLNASTSAHGLLRKLSGTSTEFLDGTGAWSTPAAGSGEANTASNVGTAGVGVFKQKTGVDLEFKKINAGSTKIQVTDDTASNEVDIDVVTANLGLTKSDVGLANVDNTADSAKPVSTAQQSALDAKADLTGDTFTGQINFSGTTHAGIKLNSLTTTERDALTPAAGMIIYNSTTATVQSYQGGAWSDVIESSTSTSSTSTQVIHGGGGQSCGDISPFDSTHLIAGTDTGGIKFSFDGGRNWETRHAGILFFQGRKAAAVRWSENIRGKCYAAVGSGSASSGGLYYSLNYGKSWVRLDTGSIFTGTIGGVSLTNQSGELIFNGGNNIDTGGGSPVLPSGAWPRSTGNLMQLDEAAGLLYVGTTKDGVWRITFNTTTHTATEILQISGTIGLYIRAIKLAKSFQRTDDLARLFIAPYNLTTPLKIMRSTNANAASPIATTLSNATTPSNCEALEFVYNNGSTTKLLYAANLGGVHVASNVGTSDGGVSFTTLGGTEAPDTTVATWMSLRGWGTQDLKRIIVCGAFEAVEDTGTGKPTQRFKNLKMGIADLDTPTTVTWVNLGLDKGTVQTTTYESGHHFWRYFDSSLIGGSGMAIPEIMVDKQSPNKIYLVGRGSWWVCEGIRGPSIVSTTTSMAIWNPSVFGNGTVHAAQMACDPVDVDKAVFGSTDHTGVQTDDRFINVVEVDPPSNTSNTGRAVHIRRQGTGQGRIIIAGGSSDIGGTVGVSTECKVWSSADLFRNGYTDEGWDTTDGAGTAMAQPIGVLSGHDGTTEFIVAVGDRGYGIWRKQASDPWTGANNAGTTSTNNISAGTWGRMLPVDPTLGNRTNEPYSTTTDLNTTPNGENGRNRDPFAPLTSTPSTEHIFTLDRKTGRVWRFSDYGRTAGVNIWSKGSEISSPSQMSAGQIAVDPNGTRLWISSDDGLWYVDLATSVSSVQAGTRVAFAASLPYAGEVPGPIGFLPNGKLMIAVQGVNGSATVPTAATARLLQVTTPATAWTATDLADDNYRRSAMFPNCLTVNADGSIVYVNCYGAGILACVLS